MRWSQARTQRPGHPPDPKKGAEAVLALEAIRREGGPLSESDNVLLGMALAQLHDPTLGDRDRSARELLRLINTYAHLPQLQTQLSAMGASHPPAKAS